MSKKLLGIDIEDIELIQEESNAINWEQRRYEIAKAAIQGLLANSEVANVDDVMEYKGDYAQKVVRSAVAYTDALIKELKGK